MQTTITTVAVTAATTDRRARGHRATGNEEIVGLNRRLPTGTGVAGAQRITTSTTLSRTTGHAAIGTSTNRGIAAQTTRTAGLPGPVTIPTLAAGTTGRRS